MGWFFRKSVGVGPFRLNLSKSGIGYSFGVRGARIGVGPRGHYVRLGRGGLYYQRYLHPAEGGGQSDQTLPTIPQAAVVEPGVPITTADVSQLQDSTAGKLLNELHEKQRKTRLAPIGATAFALTTIAMLAARLPSWVVIPCAALFVVIHVALVGSDYESKLVILNYDLDPDARLRYVKLLKAIQTLASSVRIWRVTSEQKAVDKKYTAGASALMNKKPATVRLEAPNFVETKLAVWELALGDQRLYFFPDRILVYQGSLVGAVPYQSLSVSLEQVGFVETDGVPPDSEVIGQTWRYVNKKGGPDRRFSNNQQIPIVRYAKLTMRSSSGMNFMLQCSSSHKAAEFKQGFELYAKG